MRRDAAHRRQADPGLERRVGLVPARPLPGGAEQLGGSCGSGGGWLAAARGRRRGGRRLATVPRAGRGGRVGRRLAAARRSRRRRRGTRGGRAGDGAAAARPRPAESSVGVVAVVAASRGRAARGYRQAVVDVRAGQPVGRAAREPARRGAVAARRRSIGRTSRGRRRPRRAREDGRRLGRLAVGVARPRRRRRPVTRRLRRGGSGGGVSVSAAWRGSRSRGGESGWRAGRRCARRRPRPARRGRWPPRGAPSPGTSGRRGTPTRGSTPPGGRGRAAPVAARRSSDGGDLAPGPPVAVVLERHERTRGGAVDDGSPRSVIGGHDNGGARSTDAPATTRRRVAATDIDLSRRLRYTIPIRRDAPWVPSPP